MLSFNMTGTGMTHPVVLSRARHKLYKKRIMEKLTTYGTIYEMSPRIADRMKAILANAFEIKRILDEEQIHHAAIKQERIKNNPGEVI